MKELVDLIKADPTKYNIASPGIGTTPHLSIELFKQAFGLNDLLVVPFAGGNPAIQSVVAGHTPLSFQAIPPATALIQDGKLRALAITATKRSSALPDVPTLDELGIKGQEAETMQGVLAPAGTPKEIVDLLQREIAAILAMPDVKGEGARARLRAVRHHAGRVRRLHQGRDREVEEGDREREDRQDLRLHTEAQPRNAGADQFRISPGAASQYSCEKPARSARRACSAADSSLRGLRR